MGSCFSADSRSCSPLPSSPSAANANANSNSNSNSRRRRLGGSSLDDPLHLHPIPGRLFLNGSSPLASLFSQQGKKGANQDAMLLWENFCSGKDAIFCGVFDGHGPFGHMVAKSVRDSLPLNLSSLWQLNGAAQPELNSEEAAFVSADDESRASIDSQEMDKYPPIFLTLKHSFLRAFKVMDTELKMHPSIDCFCSGTTAVTLVKQGLDLVIANVGDSRAVLATRDKDNSLTPVQLTVDLKPSLPAEADRIRKCKGRVFALQDEPEVARVWLPNNDSPGLAMARAFGDFCLKDFGLISVPEISYWRLTEKDEFVVLATDGIWDVLSNKEVVDIIATSPTRSSAARVLVESAVRAWRYKYPTSKVDDCAVVCLFLDSDSPKLSSTSHLDAKEKLSLADQINPEGVLDRSVTCRASNENSREGSNEEASKEIDAELEKEWSALEGVSRVNTLLNLPRFVPDEDVDKAMAGMRKIK